MKINPATAIDFYKSGHADQYPPGTTYVYSNFTARGDTHAKMSPLFDKKVVFFGLQGFVKWFLIDLWNKEFFEKPKGEVIAAYKRRFDNALGPGAVPTWRVEALHDLGRLPLIIKALPEGSRVNLRVPLVTVQNTHKDFAWLTNYIETVLSDELWKPITVATIAFEYRRVLDAFVAMTGSSPDFAWWQNHDFSMRGMSGVHDASSSSGGHLLSNYGTDTVPAIDYLENYYNANSDKEMIGGSVAATEHAVMCAGGSDDEKETIRRIIQDVYPSGIVSVVSDTWDFWHVITETARELKDVILNRTPNGLGQAKVVFRPDSGDPVKILCGSAEPVTELSWKGIKHLFKGRVATDGVWFEGKVYDVELSVGQPTFTEVVEPHPAQKGAVECLWDTFGGDITEKGYKTLNQRVGLIYGDSITLERQWQILERLAKKGFSAGNVVYGVGSYTYQYVTRDTFGMAMKATYAIVKGVGRELFKDPITDAGGVKKSAKGLLCVEKDGDNFVLKDQATFFDEDGGELKTVFVNGKLVRDQSLAEIRALLQSSKVADVLPVSS